MEAPLAEIQHIPGHLIRRLNQIAVAVFTDHVAEAGLELTPVQFAVLSTLSETQGLGQAALAGAVAHDKVTIGGVLDRMEQKGLVSRRISPRDRRAREISLTPEGAALLARAKPVIHALQEDILAGLDPAERETFLALLQKATEAGNALSRAPLKL
ncbi:MarR family winged helix-turn-helix transcriptional regulator [Vannielia litorea]|uniref:MarR family winged helix-turn-helix transcriptional regulator n=1 Tax=Vannielia litorea TaxID=1217970 RepID=UPI001BCB5C4B|nr:MarR family transcriptional regulator [Vannielia litorea]MBS8225380.1 MarR family transcriptional regulator [Vannielia litorea]